MLASHNGSLLGAILDANAADRLRVDLSVVISNNSGSRALERAREASIPTAHLSSQTHKTPNELDSAIADTLREYRSEWVLLAGYMKKLGPETLAAFHDRIINTHPSLLPRHGGAGFYGQRVHAAVLDAGDSVSGATIHHVNEHYDEGEIISQVRVPVRADDTVERLQARVQAAERELLIDTLADLSGRAMPIT